MESKEQLKQAIRSNMGSIKSGKDSVQSFAGTLFKEAVHELLQAEMDEHLGYEKHASNSSHFENSRNGKVRKQVKSKYGQTEIEVPRDRHGSFSQQVLPKRRRVMPPRMGDSLNTWLSYWNWPRKFSPSILNEININFSSSAKFEQILSVKNRMVFRLNSQIFEQQSHNRFFEKRTG